MIGNRLMRLTALLIPALLSSCGQNEKRYQERAQIERITALIDSKRYDSIIRWYEGPNTNQSMRSNYKRLYALAKLGKGGFDPIDAIPKILGVQNFKSSQRAKLFGDCENVPLKSFDKPEVKCLVVRLINQLPSVDNPDFIEGEQLLSDMAKAGTISDSDYTLLLILETSIVLKRVSNVMESYLYLGDNLTDEQLQFFYEQIGKAAMASDSWIESMSKSPEELSKRITGLRDMSIIKKFDGKTKFIQETGIPYILENIHGDKRDSTAVISRVLFIQVIDSTLRDYFGVD